MNVKVDSNTFKWKLLFIGLFLLVISLFFSIIFNKYYASDGTYYLMTLIEKRDFYTFQDGRTLAHYLMKLPAMMFIWLGSYNLDHISLALGAPAYLQSLLSLALSYWMIDKKNKEYICFPLIAILIGSFNTEFAAESEALVLNSFYWPVFFFIQSAERKTFLKALVFSFCAIITSLSYETYLLIGGFLAIYSHYRIRDAFWRRVLTMFFLLSAMPHLYFILSHQHPDNIQRYIWGITYSYLGIISFPGILNWMIFWSLFLLVLGFSTLFWVSERVWKWILTGMACGSLLVLMQLFSNPVYVSQYSSFSSRVLTSVMPLLISLLFVLFTKYTPFCFRGRVILLTSMICIFQSLASISNTLHWKHFSEELVIEVEKNQGVVNLTETSLNYDSKRTKNVGLYTHIWCFPLMSVFLDPDKKIKTIVQSKYSKDTVQVIFSKNFWNSYGIDILVNPYDSVNTGDHSRLE